MSRAENFKQIAQICREMSELCDAQKDTVLWWSEFGQRWQDLSHLIMDTPPKKDTHMQAAQRVMKESADARAEAQKAAETE